MKVIFLDFDGVVNDIRERDVYVNPNFVIELRKVIKETGAKIVVTSSKRDKALVRGSFPLQDSFCYKYYIQPLERMGIEIYDYTPFIIGAKLEEARELEIETYLENHSEIQDFLIIEDDFVMNRLYEHQVFIEYSQGFISEYIEPAIRILNGNLGFYPPEYDLSETFEERMRRLFPRIYQSYSLSNVPKEYLEKGCQKNDDISEELSQEDKDNLIYNLKKFVHRNR